MTVRPGGHEFVPGSGRSVGSDGRRYVLCGTCSRSRKVTPALVPVMAEPDVTTRYRAAATALLAAPDTDGAVKALVEASLRALTAGTLAASVSVAPAGAAAARTTRPSRRGDVRWVRKAIRGRYWEDIAAPALDQGFIAERTGNGHVRFCRGMQAFSLSTTVKDGNGHGFENARAAARRAGLRV